MSKPTIRVLLYTDDPNRVNQKGPLGVGELCKHLKAHESPLAVIDPKLMSRNSGPNPADHAKVRLTDALLKEFDQVWFFGIHQENKTNYSLEFPGGGGPRSELEEDEILALEHWMSVDPNHGWPGIGVLMAGDHANPPPSVVLPPGSDPLCPPLDHKTFLGLGRAIGKGVPRAGELRKWEGPPTHCLEDNFNSQFLPFAGDLNQPQHQMDDNPQPLILQTFDAQGNPSSAGQPHELFKGTNGSWIRVFPDHDHEGTLALPTKFPPAVWPNTTTVWPKPSIIAYGTDRRTGQRLDILSAYNGDAVKRGRIVADSSWHHYFNVNLKFLSADQPESAAARQLGEYYRNLAFWLSPLSRRREIADAMILWLATHPLMLEQAGSGVNSVGRLAAGLLSEFVTGCQLQELLIALCPIKISRKVQRFVFPKPTEAQSVPSPETLLGAVLSEYFSEASQSGNFQDEINSQLRSIIERGVTHAFKLNASALLLLAVESLSLLSPLPAAALSPQTQNVLESLKLLHPDSLISERIPSMSATEPSFFYQLTLDKNGKSETFSLNLFTSDSTCGVVGPDRIPVCKVWGTLVPGGAAPSAVRGTRIPLETDRSYISLEFRLRNVRIVATGVMMGSALYTRFFAFAPGDAARLLEATSTADPPRIDPADGDTGTGTGTATLVEFAADAG
jgi:hypothetical protein